MREQLALFSVWLPKELKRKLRICAAQADMSMARYVAGLLERELGKEPGPRPSGDREGRGDEQRDESAV